MARAGLEHALERALQRAEGDILLWRRIATILSGDMSMAARVLPHAPLVRIVAPSGQLVVDRGVVVSFYHAYSSPRPGEVTVDLRSVVDLIDQILMREAQEALSAPKRGRLPRKNAAQPKGPKWAWVCVETAFERGVRSASLDRLFRIQEIYLRISVESERHRRDLHHAFQGWIVRQVAAGRLRWSATEDDSVELP